MLQLIISILLLCLDAFIIQRGKPIPSANENMDVANAVILAFPPPCFSKKKKKCEVKWHPIYVIASLVSSYTYLC